ncbi:MAG: signal recognition particle receptor subunit alpha [Candidatus Aenigmatarchaeota archaeon]
MLESLSSKLRGAIDKLTRGSIDKETVEELIREIQRALISGDVDVKLVDELSENIRKRAFEKIPEGVTRRDYVTGVVYGELANIMGGERPEIGLRPKKILLCGLFGSGKTSTAAKLARFYQKKGLKVGLICCDTYRPAAYEQLEQLAKTIDATFYGEKNEKDSTKVLNNALKKVKSEIIIVDSSGRDALDKNLINEIRKLNDILKSDERILVIPADIGQAVKTQAEEFHKNLGITDIIVTKLDATAKGGGALTACRATDTTVKFIAIGETPNDLEIYDSKKFVARLIGIPDLETLLEKAKSVTTEEKAKKIIQADFTLTDFYEQMASMQQMGPLSQITDMLGIGKKIPKGMLESQQEKIKKWKFMIDSMTEEEKNDPSVMSPSRLSRIAKGSGIPESEVREFISQFEKTKKTMKKMGAGRMRRGDISKLLKGGGLQF